MAKRWVSSVICKFESVKNIWHVISITVISLITKPDVKLECDGLDDGTLREDVVAGDGGIDGRAGQLKFTQSEVHLIKDSA